MSLHSPADERTTDAGLKHNLMGCCHVKLPRPRKAAARIFKRCRQQFSMHRTLPGGSELFVRRGGGREQKSDVGSAVHRNEPLQCSGRSATLQGSFSFRNGIWLFSARLLKLLCDQLLRPAATSAFAALVGARLVSDDPLGSKTTALHQRHD